MSGIILWCASGDVEELVGLEGERPGRMGFDELDAGGEGVGVATTAFLRVAFGHRVVAGLQAAAGGRDGFIPLCARLVVAVIHKEQLDFIHPAGSHLRCLRRTGNPVDSLRNLHRAVGLDLNEVPFPVQPFHEFLGQLQSRLTSRYYGVSGRRPLDFLDDVIDGHLASLLMRRVAEWACKVTPRQTDEHRRMPRETSLALQRVKNLIDSHGKTDSKGMRLYAVHDICRRVPLAFLHRRLVTFRNLLRDPPRDILRRRVERQHVIEVAVVERVMDALLYAREVTDHPVGVEALGTAVDGHNPVVAVDIGAFALIRKLEAVGTRYFHPFGDVIHCDH